MRRGRSIRPREQPLKWVKQRAVTISRKRELEVLRESSGVSAGDAGEDQSLMQGLYAEQQTELYEPPPVIGVSTHIPLCIKSVSNVTVSLQGVIPKNDFGNIDLYVPTMLPHGAAHIPRSCRATMMWR